MHSLSQAKIFTVYPWPSRVLASFSTRTSGSMGFERSIAILTTILYGKLFVGRFFDCGTSTLGHQPGFT